MAAGYNVIVDNVQATPRGYYPDEKMSGMNGLGKH
jgi:hypothetical protein